MYIIVDLGETDASDYGTNDVKLLV